VGAVDRVGALSKMSGFHGNLWINFVVFRAIAELVFPYSSFLRRRIVRRSPPYRTSIGGSIINYRLIEDGDLG
jgi:hypothetical protein